MKHKILKIGLIIGCFSTFQVAFAIENKVALVIGNADYPGDAKLRNPVKDSEDIRDGLKKVGFDVVYVKNATFKQMKEARDEFLNKLNMDSIAVFYYAGHGVQLNGNNYLIPVDATPTNAADLEYEARNVGFFLDAMRNAGNKTNIIILDACRNNPFEKLRSLSSGGLTTQKIPTGSIIAYATEPGGITRDGNAGENGLYTKYLKDYLFKPGLSIEAALKQVNKAVRKENPDQVPSYNTSLDDDLCLAGCSVKPVQTNSPPLLSLVSGADSVKQNKSYTIKFKATDDDGDLSKIFIDWGDDSTPTSKTAKNGTTLTFTHTYKFTGIYDLIATAIDKQKNESDTFDKSIEVTEVAVVTPQPAPNPTVKIPEISGKVSSAKVTRGDEITFSATLTSDLPAGYSLKINYGNGFEIMNGSGKAFDLTVIPNASAAYKIGIYDSKNILKGKQFVSNFSVVEPAVVIVQPEPEPEPVVETPKKGDVEKFVSGSKTFGYTKIANDGSELPKTAKLGTGAKDWACTKDNNTGLIWEVKTTDGGLRDKDKSYTNYTADYPKCDESAWGGTAGQCKEWGWTNSKFGDSTNTDGFVKAVNKQGLCGAKDWRMPSKEELMQLVSCSDGKYDSNDGECTNYNSVTRPTINTTYFPNTDALSWFWCSSPSASSSDIAWLVSFNNGNANVNNKNDSNFVRLVRG